MRTRQRKKSGDISLKHNLGDGWEILHIPAESLAKRPKTFENLIKRKSEQYVGKITTA